jgi:hypothetical protein
MESVKKKRPTRVGHALGVRLFGLCMVLWSILLFTPASTAHADGGAPNLAYVAGGGNGISVIDIAQQKVTRNLTVSGDPSMEYLSLDGSYLYVAQPTLNRVTKLNARTGATACSATLTGHPSLIVFDPGTSRLYVASTTTPDITALDGNTCTVIQTIHTDSPVYGMSMAIIGPGTNGGTGNQLWFSTNNAVNIFQLPNKIQSIAIAGGPQYISIPPGATVYITTRQGTVVAVSLENLQVTPPLITGGDFGPMDFNEFTEEVYIPDKAHNQIDVLTPIYYGSVMPKEPNHVITLGVQPQSVAITSDGNLAFIALAGGHVAMYDILGKQILNTFYVGGTPRFIITGLYPPTISQASNANGTPIPVTAITIIAIAAAIVLIAIIVLIIMGRRQQGSSEEEEE